MTLRRVGGGHDGEWLALEGGVGLTHLHRHGGGGQGLHVADGDGLVVEDDLHDVLLVE